MTLLAVIAAGVYLTMTMLFKIGTIQVQTADGTVVQEVGGYSSSEILQALGVAPEENIFSFDPSERRRRWNANSRCWNPSGWFGITPTRWWCR